MSPLNERHPSSTEWATRQLRQLIFDLDWLPAELLSESDLALRLALSRTPLKQALARLQAEGLIEVMPRRGWRVLPLDFPACDHAHELMLIIESHAVSRLCHDVSRPLLDALAHQWMVPLAERHPLAEVVNDMDEAFHASLVQATGNPDMIRCHAEMTERLRRIRRLRAPGQCGIHRTYDEHAALLGALMRRRLEEAQRLLKSHLEAGRTEGRHMAMAAMQQARRQRPDEPVAGLAQAQEVTPAWAEASAS